MSNDTTTLRRGDKLRVVCDEPQFNGLEATYCQDWPEDMARSLIAIDIIEAYERGLDQDIDAGGGLMIPLPTSWMEKI